MMASTSSMSSPGSTTMASRVVSSPMIEQLHSSGPTGRISWIIGQAARDEPCASKHGVGVGPTPDQGAYFFAGWLLEAGVCIFCSTEELPPLCVASTESVMEVSIKITEHQVVALVNTV